VVAGVGVVGAVAIVDAGAVVASIPETSKPGQSASQAMELQHL